MYNVYKNKCINVYKIGYRRRSKCFNNNHSIYKFIFNDFISGVIFFPFSSINDVLELVVNSVKADSLCLFFFVL